ncbi:hypothetical protein BC936DRAFT_149858 [Jimgerdemannia flammicorona]|uniref:Uncharacterized protein n=1 Tax=Jimgerdemannia flammicorona TaxID=994334 RepID=A0A433D006_9FUNG|nr:hypothetical protein BC936DRAFT_149858 [Jimgerdemannia flammicorona]
MASIDSSQFQMASIDSSHVKTGQRRCQRDPDKRFGWGRFKLGQETSPAHNQSWTWTRRIYRTLSSASDYIFRPIFSLPESERFWTPCTRNATKQERVAQKAGHGSILTVELVRGLNLPAQCERHV